MQSSETDFETFEGLSSHIAFVRQIGRAMAADGNPTELRTPSLSEDFRQIDNGIVNASRPASPSYAHSSARDDETIRIYELPPTSETRELMRQYFSNTGLLFPFIHEPSFLTTYDRMESERFAQTSRTWLGLLNMILAMAKSTSGDPSDSDPAQSRAANVFYRRAFDLCKKQMLRGTSLETGECIISSECRTLD